MICQAKFVLGISGACSKEEVFRAFRRLALIFHPDKNGNSEESKRKFQVIQQSKVTLLTHLGEALGPAECDEGSAGPRQAKPPKNPKAERTYATASWVCSACEICERGMSPSNGRACLSTCVQIDATSQCFCGHGFEHHHWSDDKFVCTSCSCEAFMLRQPTMACVCGCNPEEHIEVFPFPCRRCTGSCQQFYSTHNCGQCGCGWACHRVRTFWKDDIHRNKQTKKSSDPQSHASTKASSDLPETCDPHSNLKGARCRRPTNMFELFAKAALKTTRSVHHPFRPSSGIFNSRSFLKTPVVHSWESSQSSSNPHAAHRDTSAEHASDSNPKSAPRPSRPYTECPRPHSATSVRAGSKHRAPTTEPRLCRPTPQRPQSACGRLGTRKIQPTQRPQSARPETFSSVKPPMHQGHEPRLPQSIRKRPQSASGRIGAGKAQPMQCPQSAASAWVSGERQSMRRPQSAAVRSSTEEPTSTSMYRQEYRPRHDKQQASEDAPASRPRPQSAHVRGSVASKADTMDPRMASDDVSCHVPQRATPAARRTTPAPSRLRTQSANYAPPYSETQQNCAIARAPPACHCSEDVSALHRPTRARPCSATATFFSHHKIVGGEEDGGGAASYNGEEEKHEYRSAAERRDERREYRPTVSNKPPVRPTHGGVRRENAPAPSDPSPAVNSEPPHISMTPTCPTTATLRAHPPAGCRASLRPATSEGSEARRHVGLTARRRAASATEARRAYRPTAGVPLATAARAQQRRVFVEHVQRERELAARVPSNGSMCWRNAGTKGKTQNSRGSCPQREKGLWCRRSANDDPSRPPLHVLRNWNNPWSWTRL